MNIAMKISGIESGRAAANAAGAEQRILPEGRPKGLVSPKGASGKQLSPLERGMLVAEAALADVPDTRDELVIELKERIRKGDYKVSGHEIADMMMRRLAADRIR